MATDFQYITCSLIWIKVRRNLRIVFKLNLFASPLSELRSQPIWPGESLWLTQLLYWMLWSLVYTGNIDKQKKDIEHKTRHKRKWIRNVPNFFKI